MASKRLQSCGSSHPSFELGMVRKCSHGVADMLSWMARAIAAMYRRDRHRRTVESLNEHLLADIGIDGDIARLQAAWAPWDPLLPR